MTNSRVSKAFLLGFLCFFLPFTSAHVTAQTLPQVEKWRAVNGKSVRSLTRHPSFASPAYESLPLLELDFANSGTQRFGRRIQGYLRAPVSGLYEFALSADDSAEFWLSSNHDPSKRMLIALTNRPTGYKNYDFFNSQTSREIFLEEGEPHFFELLHKEHSGDDYLSVEWSGPAFDRQVITSEFLTEYRGQALGQGGPEVSYQKGYQIGYNAGIYATGYNDSVNVTDIDSDGLPDFYEQAVGLNPTDASDALLDMDNDQLTNLDEYLLLTNPANADSDSDGISDSYEVLNGMAYLNSDDAYSDLDGDGVSNYDEYIADSSANNAADFPAGPPVRLVTLSWELPEEREDGSALSVAEIDGYKIYSGTMPNDLRLMAYVGGAQSLSYAQSLQTGMHYFTISTVGTDGTEGAQSDVLSIMVD